MKHLLVVFTALALVSSLPALAQAQDPCPSSCTPPEPCGWAPDIRKYPTQYVQWWANCVEEITNVVALP